MIEYPAKGCKRKLTSRVQRQGGIGEEVRVLGQMGTEFHVLPRAKNPQEVGDRRSLTRERAQEEKSLKDCKAHIVGVLWNKNKRQTARARDRVRASPLRHPTRAERHRPMLTRQNRKGNMAPFSLKFCP